MEKPALGHREEVPPDRSSGTESTLWAKRIGAGAITLILCLALVGLMEWLLVLLTPQTYYVWPPNLKAMFRPDPRIAPGIHGEKRFSINSEGFRGDEFSPMQQYRLLVIGGSTTECLILDDSEAWPRLVQDIANARQNRLTIWVGNAGKSGHNSRHHIYQVQKLLPQYPKIDAIVLLVGANDLTLRLREDAGYVPYGEAPIDRHMQVFHKAFSLYPSWESDGPIYKRSEIWRRLKLLKERVASRGAPYIQDERGSNLVKWRAHRESASELVDVLPDLTSALREYSENLRNIVHLAAERKVRVILMTQPALWRQDLPSDLTKLLWLGGIGDFQARPGSRYYSVGALSLALAKYNETVLALCRELSIECVDLAAQLPRNTDTFYDDFHFNEKGSRAVAEILARHLLEASPFTGH